MVNEEKVRLMSRMAMFETGEGKETLEIDGYSKKDYGFVQVIKTFIISTIMFGVIVFFALLLCMETVASLMVVVGVKVMIALFIAFYIAFEILICIVTKKRCNKRYEEYKNEIKKYEEMVSDMNEFYESGASS